MRRILTIFSNTGTVSKKVYPSEKAFRKITKPVQYFILHLVLKKPDIYLQEITTEVKGTLGLDITERYSLRGKPVKTQKLHVCSEHVSAIAAISTKGLVAL